MASLHVRGSQEQQYLLEKEETILGRNPDCDVVIPSRQISRRHARILRDGDRFYLEDMDTPGGTRMVTPEGIVPIRGRVLLRDEDVIWFDERANVQFRE